MAASPALSPPSPTDYRTPPCRDGGDGEVTTHRAPTSAWTHSGPLKHAATLHKVQRLLDTPIDEDMRDMLVYVDTLAPHLFGSHNSPHAPVSTDSTNSTATVCHTGHSCFEQHQQHQQQQQQQPEPQTAAKALSLSPYSAPPQPLRRTLEMRIPALHRDFVRSLATLNDAYETAAARVQSLHSLCTELHHTLTRNADAVRAFVAQANQLQTARAQARGRSAAVRDFARRFDFDTAQRQLLQDTKATVDGRFIDAVLRARAVQRRCRALLLSPEYQSSAAAMMEGTFQALNTAVDTMTRFLLHALAGASETEPSMYKTNPTPPEHPSRAASRWAGEWHSGTRGSARVGADVAEVSRLFLRTAHVLRAESALHWSRVLTAMAQLRASSVLRRYVHLMTTGSAQTTARGGGASGRPLEAALNDPLYFFGALFAWLHQAMVEEDEFFALFDHTAEEEEEEEEENENNQEEDADGVRRGRAEEKACDTWVQTRRGALGMTFAGLSMPVQTALEAVLQRTLVLHKATHGSGARSPAVGVDAVWEDRDHRRGADWPGEDAGGAAGVARHSDDAAHPHNNSTKDGTNSHREEEEEEEEDTMTRRGGGLRGLFSTRRLGNLWHTARHRAWREVTGRHARAPESSAAMQPTSRQVDSSRAAWARRNASYDAEEEEEEEEEDTSEKEEAGGRRQRQAKGMPSAVAGRRFRGAGSRGEQEVLAAATLVPTLRDIELAVSLGRLFDYYGNGTVRVMLGGDAALTVVLLRTAPDKLHRVWMQRLAMLRQRVWDSTVGAVQRATVLRPLASAYEWTHRMHRQSAAADAETNYGMSPANHRDSSREDGLPRGDMSGGSVCDGSRVGNKKGRILSHFVVDFLLRYGGGAEAAEWTDRPSRVASSRSDQQQCTAAHTLARELAQLTLPVSVEYTAALHTLDSVLREGARHAEVLQTLRARRRQQQQQQHRRANPSLVTPRRHRRLSMHDDGTSVNALTRKDYTNGRQSEHPDDEEEAEAEEEQETWIHPSAWMLLWLLLSYPSALQRHTTLQRSLDGVCTVVMALNALGAVGQVVQRHADYIHTIGRIAMQNRTGSVSSASHITASSMLEHGDTNRHPATATADAHRADGGTKEGEKGKGDEAEAEAEAARDVARYVRTRIDGYLCRLTESYAAAVVEACFPSTHTPTPLAEGDAAHASKEESATRPAVGTRVGTRRVGVVLRELHRVYTWMASAGKLFPLPLLDSLACETQRGHVRRAVTQRLIERYTELYAEMRVVWPGPTTADGKEKSEEWAGFADMAPDKLRVLVDEM